MGSNGRRPDGMDPWANGEAAGGEPANETPANGAPAKGEPAADREEVGDGEDALGASEDLPGDPAEMLALIRSQQDTVRKGTEPSGPLLFGAWGVAWLAGYLVLFVSGTQERGLPAGWAFAVFGLLLVSAMVFTGVHIGRRAVGVRGASAAVGAMYGWSWAVCFAVVFLILSGVARAGASHEVMQILSNSLSCLVVAALYMAGGALWREWRMFALGVWIALVAGGAALLGPPSSYLLMAVAGGGGFLLGAAAGVVVDRRRSQTAAAETATVAAP